MRILFFGVSGGLGGAERVLTHAVASIRRERPGWSVRVISVEEGPLRREIEWLGAEYVVLPLPASFAGTGEFGRRAIATAWRLAAAAPTLAPYVARLRAAVRAWAPDVVHANGLKADILAAAARPRAARLVWHVHDYVGSRHVSARLLRLCAPRAHVVAANSESVAADLRQVIGARASVRTVLNSVDTARFAPAGSAADLDALAGQPPAPPGTMRVGLVATYARWKGHDTFLAALASLPPGTPVRGYVIGGPQYQVAASQLGRDDLVRLAEGLGVADRVAFVDFQADTAPVYRALDIVVHASTAPEPFGLVIAEALSCGRAVVASATGGALEIGDAGRSVLRHAPGDAAALAAAIARLAGDAPLRARLGHAGREFALARLTRERFARDVLQLYE
jgi:glycosyltransferase involved in cell wall biosynthesis